jgi:putative salt-induced outer membrane protein YdiY
MKGVKGILLFALAVLPCTGFAGDGVTNITWKSSIAMGATYKSGNTEKSLFTMNLKGDRYAPESDWLNSLYGETGKTRSPTTEKEQTEGQLRGQSDYRYKFGSKNFFGGIFGEAYYDDIKDIRTRLKLGPNVGYYFINKATMKLDASIGVNYVYERTSTSEKDFGEYRAAANYLWEFTETASYYLNLEYSANVEDTDDGNGLLVTGLKSKINSHFALFVELRDEYDNLPATPTTMYNDVTVIAGLTYDF